MDVLIGRRAVETWPIDRLRPYERNSRRYSAERKSSKSQRLSGNGAGLRQY
jgi:hypothetical protein